ncbi:N-6 DNA methylase [Marinomonas sp. IMCC 4694]|uniref:N-6 DNA methylase n=1 Tax=Marinomonas sp. IMCC 4694 TaxID=2605432 RepID=UPI0011E6B86B|nr:N-6 DNA methylase [Marinomonas sp. IMCC 4694]TYL48425.1 N-6 DNA methylase [Marinomonas sp. IMCC 4694]
MNAYVALPTDMFYNTGIATYVWILSNNKQAECKGLPERRGKVQLINGVNLSSKMRKSLGSKRNEMSIDDIALITRTFGAFEVIDATDLQKPAEQKSSRGRQASSPKVEAPKTFAAKIFDTHEFGYRRISIERPLRESFQFSDERLEELRFANKPLEAPMKWIYETFGHSSEQPWSDDKNCGNYGLLAENEVEIRVHLKANFSDVKEAKIKELLDRKMWLAQKAILLKAKKLQAHIGTQQYNDMNQFDAIVKAAAKAQGIKLDTKELKAITAAVSWKNPAAEKVIKKIHKSGEANPFYGLFEVELDGKTQVIEYKPDGDLRDNENVALDPTQTVNELNEAYFKKEVQPHVPDAWIDATKRDAIDGKIGIVGYEIPFNRHFYQYQPPRDLVEIDKELDLVSAEIMGLLQEVHS